VSWLLPRVLAAVMAMLLGGGLGWILADATHVHGAAPWWLTAVGAALGVTAAGVVDALRGQRLMLWLRGSKSSDAPRNTGFWGELAYRIERSLRQLERNADIERLRLAQFLSAIEASPNGVLLLDADDRIDWLNAVAAEHFGLNPQRDRQQPVTNLVRSPAFVACMQEARFTEPVVFTAPNGRSTLSVVVSSYGEGMKLLLSQDVTERERSDAMRRDFVANVSHEIRTPLTVLAGFVETLTDLPLSERERARVLSLMAQQTDRMQALVGDLLTLAQLEGSPRPAADRWLAVTAILQRALTDATALSAGRHSISIHGGEDAELAGSENEVLSAVGNLMNNAVRYTQVGGQIELRWVWRDDGGAELLVVDSGVGIAREHLPRLTERFYRVDSSRSRDTGGTGLGLAIVKHVAQRHGGEIDVQSDLGKGSSFRIVLPAVRVRRRVPLATPATAPLETSA
jgi:two-component system, OmpR family, phosphate regulon sensor histidine kinase PhoR